MRRTAFQAAAMVLAVVVLTMLASEVGGQAGARLYLPITGTTRGTFATATPNPLAAACDNLEQQIERSWAWNAGLDGSYPNGVPIAWTPFSRGSVRFFEETGAEKWGRASWRIEGSGAFSGGAWQVVTETVPGQWYHAFYATAQLVVGNGRRDGSLPLLREVGLDPTGGTNPDSATVIWGRSAGGLPDKIAGKYGGWKTLGNANNPLVSARAIGDRMTMFLRVSGWPDVEQGIAWVDSVFFVDACDPTS